MTLEGSQVENCHLIETRYVEPLFTMQTESNRSVKLYRGKSDRTAKMDWSLLWFNPGKQQRTTWSLYSPFPHWGGDENQQKKAEKGIRAV